MPLLNFVRSVHFVRLHAHVMSMFHQSRFYQTLSLAELFKQDGITERPTSIFYGFCGIHLHALYETSIETGPLSNRRDLRQGTCTGVESAML